jgi:hypothetical protein
MASKPLLRNNPKYHHEYLGILTTDLVATAGCQLPSNGDILKHYFYLKRDEFRCEGKDKVIDIVVEKAKLIWDMAKIPAKNTTKNKSLKEQVLKLIQTIDNLVCAKKRPTFNQKLEAFKIKLNELFDISSHNAVELIQKDTMRNAAQKNEDILFLEDQKTDRKMCLGKIDHEYVSKVERKMCRITAEEIRAENELIRVKLQKENKEYLSNDVLDELLGTSSVSADPSFEPPKSRRQIGETSRLKVFQSEKVSNLADRLNLSSRQRTAITAVVASECGIDLKNVSLSKETARRSGIRARTTAATKIREEFEPPVYCVIHWDSKLISEVSGGYKDRLAILVSGVPTAREGKLLAVPEIPDSTGASQAKAVYSALTDWNCIENVNGIVFDTTASNSGWMKGACVNIEEKLGKKQLWLACRHHVSERILSSTYILIFGKTTSPYNEAFKKFRDEIWKTIDTTKPYKTLEIKDRRLKAVKNCVITFLQNKLSGAKDCSNNIFIRSDYKEAAELCIIILGEIPCTGLHWFKPGAFHNARWMTAILYPIKMLAFSDQSKYDQLTINKLERLCLFVTLIYVKYWLSSSVAADAPVNDLELYKILIKYMEYDSELAAVAMKTFNNHYWYMTEEVVPFAFFSEKCSNDIKKQLAKAIMKQPNKVKDLARGKPIFPVLTPSTNIQLLVGPNSWFIFQQLGCDGEWLKNCPTTWKDNEEYKKMHYIFTNIKVVNDTAERGVKLVSDFAHSITNNEQQRQYLLQVVEHNRSTIPDFRKKTLMKALQ